MCLIKCRNSNVFEKPVESNTGTDTTHIDFCEPDLTLFRRNQYKGFRPQTEVRDHETRATSARHMTQGTRSGTFKWTQFGRVSRAKREPDACARRMRLPQFIWTESEGHASTQKCAGHRHCQFWPWWGLARGDGWRVFSLLIVFVLREEGAIVCRNIPRGPGYIFDHPKRS